MTDNLLYFLSPHHSRSMFAEAWAQRLNLPNWSFASSGWHSKHINPLSVNALRELNIDFSNKQGQLATESLLKNASYIITLYDFSNESMIPLPDKYQYKTIEWDVKNPNNSEKTELDNWVENQEVCDEIATRIKDLSLFLKNDQ